MIEQVLMNLILNAVQAMKQGGVLTIRTSVAEGICRIEVIDTGGGIPPASILPRVFDPFFTTKGEGEGTGLGLSVNLGIMERHGGGERFWWKARSEKERRSSCACLCHENGP
ncbi:MAG: ATP-binding protein [Nitrospira sp.]